MSQTVSFLFNKSYEDMRAVGRRGGRARARNLRLRKAAPAPVAQIIAEFHIETAAEAIQVLDRQFPWLRGVERRSTRRPTA